MAAINPANKQRQRALDDALQTRMSARFERRLRTEIGRTMREAADAYEKRGELAIPLAVSEHAQGIRNVLEADYRLVANHFGKRLLKEAKAHAGPQVIKASLTEMLGLAVNGFINRWIATKVTQINRTTESQIRGIIRGGLDEGLGVDKIGKRIRQLSTPFSALRAHVIARTETHTAANFGAQEAAELTGLDMKREWVSSMDDRTRDEPGADHVAADGQIVGMKEPFTVSGEKLMFPGDPAGSAANTIMCFTGDTPVGFGSIKKSIKSVYSGKLITIKTAAGHKLTGTPNHPVMTDRGFIPLGEVDQSTNLICCPINVNFANALNVDHIHSTFKQVHDAAKIEGMTVGMGSVGVNLYGRIPDAKIEVVDASRNLLSHIKSAQLQGLAKFKFKVSDLASRFFFHTSAFFHGLDASTFWYRLGGCMSSGNLRGPFVMVHERPLYSFRLALRPSTDSSIDKRIENNFSANAKTFGDAVFTFPAGVWSDDLIGKLNMKARPDIDFVSFQSLVNKSLGDSEFFRHFPSGMSRNVHIDNAFSIDVFECHDEPVYTVETDQGIYNAGGIIASNCRCQVVFIYD